MEKKYFIIGGIALVAVIVVVVLFILPGREAGTGIQQTSGEKFTEDLKLSGDIDYFNNCDNYASTPSSQRLPKYRYCPNPSVYTNVLAELKLINQFKGINLCEKKVTPMNSCKINDYLPGTCDIVTELNYQTFGETTFIPNNIKIYNCAGTYYYHKIDEMPPTGIILKINMDSATAEQLK